MLYSWAYGSQFSASSELQTMLNGWYQNGTEVIFACGGSMSQSAFAAASANQAKVVGVDVDQSGQSETVITSAVKGLHESILYVCDKQYTDKWSDIGGKLTTLGATEDAVGLPTATWQFKNFSLDEYNKLFEALKKQEVVVSRDYNGLETQQFEHVRLSIIE